VLPGLPREMEEMFDHHAEEFRAERPIGVWRRKYQTGESRIAGVLVEATDRWPMVTVGSYPSFQPEGPQVEVVLKSADAEALAEAVAWIEPALAASA